MPQNNRSMERAFCDQGEKALLRPEIRREYDALLKASRRPGRTSAERGVAEREARLREARERVEHHSADDARMAPGDAMFLAIGGGRGRARRRATAPPRPGPTPRDASRRPRAPASRAPPSAGSPSPSRPAPCAPRRGLNTLGGARRDVGDLAGSEAALRESVALLPTVRENAPGWIALVGHAPRPRRPRRRRAGRAEVIEEDEEDAYGWRALAFV